MCGTHQKTGLRERVDKVEQQVLDQAQNALVEAHHPLQPRHWKLQVWAHACARKKKKSKQTKSIIKHTHTHTHSLTHTHNASSYPHLFHNPRSLRSWRAPSLHWTAPTTFQMQCCIAWTGVHWTCLTSKMTAGHTCSCGKNGARHCKCPCSIAGWPR